MDKVKPHDCHFCSPGRKEHSANICLPIRVCDKCLEKVNLVLNLPAANCPCGTGRNLVAFQLDGIHQAVCEYHLPLNLASKLAKDMTNNFGYMNAPSFYGSKENFDLIKQLGFNQVTLLSEQTELRFNTFMKVLRSINKTNEVVSY